MFHGTMFLKTEIPVLRNLESIYISSHPNFFVEESGGWFGNCFGSAGVLYHHVIKVVVFHTIFVCQSVFCRYKLKDSLC